MTAPLDPGVTWWDDEGRRIAGQLHDVSSLLVIGVNPEFAARVALGIARAESERRHVALGDLVGDVAAIYAVAGGEDAFGLTDCLRQGLPLNDIARPAPDRASLFILPAGSPPVACAEILAHERWPRLVNGFTKAGALLMLVAPLDAPGLGALAAATGGAVLVDVPVSHERSFRVLERVAARVEPRAETVSAKRGGRGLMGRALTALGAIALLALAAWMLRGRIAAAIHGAQAPHAMAPLAAAPVAAPAEAPPPADTVRLTDPVNPADTSATAAFAVEVMAANTLAGANSFLSDHVKNASLHGATVSPVAVGGSSSVWYKVVAGASHDRAGADSLLAGLRRDKLVRSGEGRVVKVPYALVLEDNVERSQAQRLRDSWTTRGFNPYFLEQTDGSVRLLAGAFETPAQAASLASALRAAGVAPVLAFRTGRTY